MKKLLVFSKRYLFAAGCFLYTCTFGVFTSRGRHLVLKTCEHFGYLPKFVRPELPVKDVQDVVDGNVPVRVLEPTAANGNVSLLELLVLCQLVQQTEARTVLEIGTFDGRTTINLAAKLFRRRSYPDARPSARSYA